MIDEFVLDLISQAPTLGVLLFLVWQQWTLIKTIVAECLEKDDDDG